MVSRRGAVKRKKVPQPIMAEEPPLAVNCICCHCDAMFRPFDVTGSYLERTCPSCGAVLDEASYDSAHEVASKEFDHVEAEMPQAEAEVEKWTTWVDRFHWAVFKPIRSIFEKKAARSRIRKDDLHLKHYTLRKRFTALAVSRYYTGEWFQRTHTPLTRTVVTPYRINVCYGKDGEWHINQTDRLTSGIVAEFMVFQHLLDRVRDPLSPLYGAQIVPNIYLPHEQRSGKAEKLWSQIDCVVLTRQAAFVIEVKRRKKRIVALGPFEEVWSTEDGSLMDAYVSGKLEEQPENAGFTDESFALKQNSCHAVAFDEECETYPFERIYEQVVYVGSSSFHTDCHEFIDNVNVSHLGCVKPGFADIIEAECGSLDDIISETELSELGESLVAAFCDLNQKRGQLHAERLKRIRDD